MTRPALLPHRPRLSTACVSVLLSLALGGCAGAPRAQQPPRQDAPVSGDVIDESLNIVDAPPQSAEAEFNYHLLAAELADRRGEDAVAAREFIAVAKISGDAGAAARATRSALQAQDPVLSREASQLWLDLEPSSMEAREVLFRLALLEGDTDQAVAQAHEMIGGHAGGIDDGLREVAQVVAQSPTDTEVAHDLMAALVERYPTRAAAYYGQALVAYRSNALDAAEGAARKGMQLAPDALDLSLLVVGIQVERGDFDAAAELIDDLSARPGADDAELRLTHARLLLDAGERDRARTVLEALLAEHPQDASAHYALGVLALNDRNVADAREHFTQIRDDATRGADARYQLAAIAERERRYEDAVQLYETVTGGNQTLEAVVGRARSLAGLGRLDEARLSLALIRQQFPPLAAQMSIAEAQILIDAGRGEEALGLYERGLADDPQDLELLYGRSLAHEKLGDFAAAEADLRQMLEIEPNSTQALNALGYLLTVHTTRYEEARELIQRALENEPDDPAIIDSLGWVEYKLGNLEAARSLLEEAHEGGADPEIAAHLGEVLWKLGDQTRARRVWNDAQQMQPDHPVLIETIRRLDR